VFALAKKKFKLTKSKFRISGKDSKLKIDDKKARRYYFRVKLSEEEARDLAAETGSDLFEISQNKVEMRKPSLKYDFYCIYDAELNLKFLRKRKQEVGVQEQLMGAMVGKEIYKPRKGKDVPGKAVFLEMIELFEIENDASFILDGVTGFPAKTLEKLLKGPGKKKVTASWKKKARIASGKYKSLEKVVKSVAKDAKKVPKGTKRVLEHTLTFKTLKGFYVPTYYVNISADGEKRKLRINAVNGNVALKV